MSFPEFDEFPSTDNNKLKKFTEDLKYINAKLEDFNSKLSSEITFNRSSINHSVHALQDTFNPNSVHSIKQHRPKRKIEDQQNLPIRSENSDKNQNVISAASDPFETFSKSMAMEHRFDANNIDKKIVEFAPSFIDKVKNTARLADVYVKKLNEEVLPRCQSTDITSNIVKRDVNHSIKTAQYQNHLKKKLDKNINNNNKSSNKMLKPKPLMKKHVHFNISSENLCKTNNYQPPSNAFKSSASVNYNKNNIGIINIKAQDTDEKEINHCKFQKLTVQQTHMVDLKPELVTKKLVNIWIKPDSKQTLNNCKPNVAYHEYTYELEPKTCKCQSSVRPVIINDKNAALCEIRNTLYGILNNVSSNDILSNHLIVQLQKILIKLDETKFLEGKESNILKDLVEEHSMFGFSEMVIKQRLMEIAKNYHDEVLSDQMPLVAENNNNQITQQISTIKNTILPPNSSMKFSNLLENNQTDNRVEYIGSENLDLYSIISNKYVSVKEFLHKNLNNDVSSKIFKNSPIVKKSSSSVTLCSKDDEIENLRMFDSKTAENILNSKNNISPLKEHQLEFKNQNQNQNTSLEKHASSESSSSLSITVLTTHLKPSEKEFINNEENYYNNNEKDNRSKIDTGMSNECYKNNNELSIINCDQLPKNKESENFININTDIGQMSVGNQIQNHKYVQPKVKEWILNSLSFTSLSSNNQHTDGETEILDKDIESSSTSTTFSMMSLKESIERIKSDTDCTSLGEVRDNYGLYNNDSSSSPGEIKY